MSDEFVINNDMISLREQQPNFSTCPGKTFRDLFERQVVVPGDGGKNGGLTE